jgi:serine/threonine protein kinase
MSIPVTTESLLDLCRKSGVVDTAQLDSFLGSHRLPPAPRQAAIELVRHGILTQFQARQFLVGKYKGFFLGGQLKVLDYLGHGGMGCVYLCEQIGMKRKVAVKVLPEKQAKDPIARERFYREARIAAALDHPNIVHAYDIKSENQLHFIVMEYVEGTDLETLVRQRGPMPMTEAVGYVIQAALGLQHAHDRGLVHRDMKPGNLLLDKSGTVKILDMGLARFFVQEKDDKLTERLEKGVILGTVDYLAPEQAVQSSGVDRRADIYSLGATLYTLLTASPVFDGTMTQKLVHIQMAMPESITKRRPEIPLALTQVVEKMMAKRPEDRFQSAADAIEALCPFAPDLTSAMSTVISIRKSLTDRVPAPKPQRFTRKQGLIGGGIFAVLLAGLITFLSGGSNPPEVIPVVTADRPKQQENPTPITPKVEAKQPTPKMEVDSTPAVPKPLYQLNFASLTDYHEQIRNRSQRSFLVATKLPKPWRTQCWKPSTLGEFKLVTHEGEKGIAFSTLEGDPSCELHTSASPEAFQCKAMKSYRFELVYRAEGQAHGRFDIRIGDSAKPGGANQINLPTTNGKWQRVTLTVSYPEDSPLFAYISNYTRGAGNRLTVRSLELFDADLPRVQAPPPAEKDLVSIYQLTPGSKRDLSMWVKGDQILFQQGDEEWFPNLHIDTWNRSSVGEIAIEKFKDVSTFVLRNHEGEPSIQLFTNGSVVQAQSQKKYLIQVEYRLAGTTTGAVFLRRSNGSDLVKIPLEGTAPDWQTARVEWTPKANEAAHLFVHNFNPASDNAVFIRKVEILTSR